MVTTDKLGQNNRVSHTGPSILLHSGLEHKLYQNHTTSSAIRLTDNSALYGQTRTEITRQISLYPTKRSDTDTNVSVIPDLSFSRHSRLPDYFILSMRIRAGNGISIKHGLPYIVLVYDILSIITTEMVAHTHKRPEKNRAPSEGLLTSPRADVSPWARKKMPQERRSHFISSTRLATSSALILILV